MHITHINRLLVIFSLLTAIVPLSMTAMLLQQTQVLSAAMIWMMY